MKIAIAGDHYTVELVDQVSKLLVSKGIVIENLGTDSKDKKISLQDIIPAIVNKVRNNDVDFGILACGTGVGVEIGANRFKGIRASLCRDADQAKNARIYDNANLLCLGSWYNDDIPNIVEAWINSSFDGDAKRTKMLQDFDTLD
jgi:ribose 5-phosphate isomerase B